MKNYYEVLEISENASQEVIERVYKLFAKKYHPDLNPDNPKEAEEKFKEITEAYETLSDESKRKSYDDNLKYEKQKAERTTSTSSSSAYSASSTSYNNYSTNNNSSSANINHTNNKNDSNLYEENVRIYNTMMQENQARLQAEREYQIKKAYNDAYYEALQRMGIKVVYKKSFHEKINGFIDVITFLIILAAVIAAAYQMPEVRESVGEVLNMIPRGPL